MAISLTNVASRAHFEAGSTPSTFLVGRYVIVVVLLTAFFSITGHLRALSRRDTLDVAIAGSLNLIGASGLAFAIQRLPVSLAVAVLYLFPFFALFIGAALDRRVPRISTLLALCVAFFGLVLALDVGGTTRPDPIGLLFAVMAAFGIATSFVSIERRLDHMGDAMRLYGINVAGLVGAVILAMVTADVVWPLPSPGGWSTLLVATATFAVASAAMFMAVSRIGATTTSLLMNLEPPATALLAVLILGDALTTLQFAGIVIVIAAITSARYFGRTQ